MKRMLVIITLLLLSFALTQLQINRINTETLQSYEPVYVFAKSYTRGMKIDRNDIKEGKINRQFMSDDYDLTFDDIIGQTLVYDVNENTVVTSAVLNKTTDQTTDVAEGNAVISLKMLPETAVCWQMMPGELVSLYWVSGGEIQNMRFIGDVRVKDILNEQLEADEVDQSTRYILIEASNVIVENIIMCRDNGRFEIILKDAGSYQSKF